MRRNCAGAAAELRVIRENSSIRRTTLYLRRLLTDTAEMSASILGGPGRRTARCISGALMHARRPLADDDFLLARWRDDVMPRQVTHGCVVVPASVNISLVFQQQPQP